MNDLTKACIGGAILGTTFCVGAAVTDILIQRRKPHHTVFYDPADFLKSLGKQTATQ